MSDNVLGISELQIKPGELDNFCALVKEMVDATRANEPDAICYEYFISQDGRQCHIYERYADSAAVMTHLANFSQFPERFMAAVEMTGLTLYGNPSDEVREAVRGLSPVFWNLWTDSHDRGLCKEAYYDGRSTDTSAVPVAPGRSLSDGI